MNNQELLTQLKLYSELSEDNAIHLSISTLGYIDVYGDLQIVNYDKFAANTGELISLLKELKKDGFIELIDTNNMGFVIIPKS